MTAGPRGGPWLMGERAGSPLIRDRQLQARRPTILPRNPRPQPAACLHCGWTAEPETKEFAGLAQILGQPPDSNRDFQSKYWATLQNFGSAMKMSV